MQGLNQEIWQGVMYMLDHESTNTDKNGKQKLKNMIACQNQYKDFHPQHRELMQTMETLKHYTDDLRYILSKAEYQVNHLDRKPKIFQLEDARKY